MIFSSDNWAGAHPAIAESLVTHAAGYASAYGTSELDRTVEKKFSEIFEKDVAVFFVGTGTAANALALSSANRAGGIAFCHREAHVNVDECGAPSFFSHGARLCPVGGERGRMDPAKLEAGIRRFPKENVHGGQPMAVTLTQATESGTVYSLDQIESIGSVATAHELPLHMDGARFANALVSLGTTPAEMTWKRGVDLLSFGGTKNGCWCAEALVLFDRSRAQQMHFLRKRSAQLFSKSRFVAAQFDAYLTGDLWLDLARQANAGRPVRRISHRRSLARSRPSSQRNGAAPRRRHHCLGGEPACLDAGCQRGLRRAETRGGEPAAGAGRPFLRLGRAARSRGQPGGQ
ncbi:low specificity L-threonine aldolase [Sinorhizobium medicae]|nr:low specificity L-threonine aldolase [Sinorhizobium medicae]